MWQTYGAPCASAADGRSRTPDQQPLKDIVFSIAHLRHLPVVFLKQPSPQAASNWLVYGTPCLYALADVYPDTIHLFVILNIKLLHITIRQPRICLEDEQIASHINIRPRCRLELLDRLHFVISQVVENASRSPRLNLPFSLSYGLRSSRHTSQRGIQQRALKVLWIGIDEASLISS